jgi:hypothetical protein
MGNQTTETNLVVEVCGRKQLVRVSEAFMSAPMLRTDDKEIQL